MNKVICFPCPFCGEEPELLRFFIDKGHGDGEEVFFVECNTDGCRCRLRGHSLTPHEAAARWNKRAIHEGQTVEVKRYSKAAEWFEGILPKGKWKNKGEWQKVREAIELVASGRCGINPYQEYEKQVEMVQTLKWARGSVPYPSGCHKKIVEVIQKCK